MLSQYELAPPALCVLELIVTHVSHCIFYLFNPILNMRHLAEFTTL